MSEQSKASDWSLGADAKLGLALSGGGFRASLFHIGVLARMAELGLLWQVQILSTVSGGSIIGAYYYLKVKELLEGGRTGPDGRPVQPSRQAYIDIVAEIEVDFLRAVQTNIRTQTLLDPIKNGRMAVSDDYSRSDRIAELYQQHFYTPLWTGPDRRVLLKDLKIRPGGEEVTSVEAYNAANEFKIPVLTLNATTLNTGHAWRFTASYVGEFPRHDPTLDTTVALGCFRFDGKHSAPDAPDDKTRENRQAKLDELTLADAVAASACVPGIFTPLAIHDLCWNSRGEEIVVELVDGGVFDNQGVDALLELPAGQKPCTHVICSDASGQIEDLRAPASRALAVAGRAQDVLMTRVREEVFRGLNADERKANGLKAFSFFHLREVAPSVAGSAYPQLPGPVDRTDPAKMDGHVYRLSNLRTDLDSFTDIEAHSLMYHAYCLSDCKLAAASDDLNAKPGRDWRFLNIISLIQNDPDKLAVQLGVGKHKLFKIFRLNDPVAWLLGIVAAVVAFLFGWFVHSVLVRIPPSLAATALELAGLVAALAWLAVKLEDSKAAKALLDEIRNLRRGERWYLTTLPAVLFGWIGSVVAIAQLRLFDPRFLAAGAIPNAPPAPPSGGTNPGV
jgi:NTE family protein